MRDDLSVFHHHEPRVGCDNQASDQPAVKAGKEEVGIDHSEQVEDITDPLAAAHHMDEHCNQDNLGNEERCVRPVQCLECLLAFDCKLERES